MKLLRSRFRLITLLLACLFLLAAIICTASALKQAGIVLPSVQQVLPASPSHSPEPSPAVEEEKEEEPPVSSEIPAVENLPGETDIRPDSEYNIFGL